MILETLNAQLEEMASGFIKGLPAFAIAIVILLITWIVARSASSIANRLIGRTELRPSLRNLIETLVRLAVWLVGTLIAAIVFFPDLTPASLLAGLGVGSVAIGFAFKDIFENFFAGVLIMLREKMRIGDIIECEGIMGKVEHISLRETHIRSLSGELTILPNSLLFKSPVEIWTDADQRRYEVVIGVSYDTDLDQADDVIRKAVNSVELVDKDKHIDVIAQEFNSSSVDFLVRWWAPSSGRESFETRDKVIRAIKRHLDEAKIEIPFPYVTHTFKEEVPLGDKAGEEA